MYGRMDKRAVALIESSNSRREQNRTKGSCNQTILDLCLPYNTRAHRCSSIDSRADKTSKEKGGGKNNK